jgi:hypothetical protein
LSSVVKCYCSLFRMSEIVHVGNLIVTVIPITVR